MKRFCCHCCPISKCFVYREIKSLRENPFSLKDRAVKSFRTGCQKPVKMMAIQMEHKPKILPLHLGKKGKFNSWKNKNLEQFWGDTHSFQLPQIKFHFLTDFNFKLSQFEDYLLSIKLSFMALKNTLGVAVAVKRNEKGKLQSQKFHRWT